jgi:hypothetical protein
MIDSAPDGTKGACASIASFLIAASLGALVLGTALGLAALLLPGTADPFDSIDCLCADESAFGGTGPRNR